MIFRKENSDGRYLVFGDDGCPIGYVERYTQRGSRIMSGRIQVGSTADRQVWRARDLDNQRVGYDGYRTRKQAADQLERNN